MPHREHSFVLPLAGGMDWTFTTSSGGPLASWLDEFAHILRLKKAPVSDAPAGPDREKFAGTNSRAKASSLPRRGLVHIVPMDESREPAEPGKSWSSYAQGSAYRVRVNRSADEAILEISPKFIGHPEIRYIYMSAALRIVFRHCVASGTGCSLHAASAVWNGKGIIITASGQTGKSTCYDRLPETWKPLADDSALAVKSPSGGFAVQPMPTWSDYLRRAKPSTFETGTAYPLKALFFLERGAADEVKPVLPSISAGILHRLSREAWAGFLSRFPAAEKKQLGRNVFDACCAVANATPGYILRATLHGKFWREIEKVL